MNKPEKARVGDVLRVVDRMPQGVWGYPFSVDPDAWLVPVEPDKKQLHDAADLALREWGFGELADRVTLGPERHEWIDVVLDAALTVLGAGIGDNDVDS